MILSSKLYKCSFLIPKLSNKAFLQSYWIIFYKNFILQLPLTSTLTLLIVLATENAHSQTRSYKYELGFKSDNDAYLGIGQDKYYTNGLFIAFRGVVTKQSSSPKINKRLWELEINQQIYTPQSGYILNNSSIDRPFAGYLYASGGFYRFYNSENLLKTTLQLGIIGPASLAEDAQIFIHKIAGFYAPQGWQTQISNHFTLNTNIEYYHFLHRSKFRSPDFTAVSTINIGNAFTNVSAGLLFRLGKINPLFNSASTNSRIATTINNVINDKEFFFYAKPQLSYRLYDGTIEGETLASNNTASLNFKIKPFALEQKMGVVYATNRWTANFSIIFRSKEIKNISKPDQFASISLYYRFSQAKSY